MKTQQHYTLDQLKELVQVGLINIPSNDLATMPEIPYPSIVNNTIQGGLDMVDSGKKGSVRTNQKCPKCGGSFEFVNLRFGLACKTCFTIPTRFFIDIYNKKRIRLFANEKGQVLKSFDDAYSLLTSIREKIKTKEKNFDPERYIKQKQREFQFDTYSRSFLVTYEKRLAKDDISPNTYSAMKASINKYFIPFFDKTDIRDITGRDIESFYQSFRDNLSPKSIQSHMVNLRTIFNRAKKLEDIKKVPIFPKITVPEKEISWIDEATQDETFSKIPQEDRDIILFTILHGCRPGETCGLQWTQLNLNKGSFTPVKTMAMTTLRNTTKTGKIQARPLHPTMIEVLKKYPKPFNKKQFVFVNSRTGNPYTTKIVWRIWREACKKTGLNISLYPATRHSFASQAVNRNVPIELISKALGHRNLKTTQKYAQIETRTLKQVYRKKVVNLHKSNNHGTGRASTKKHAS